MSSPDAGAAAPAAVKAVVDEPVRDKAYWKARRESANKLPPHPCSELQQKSLACASAAGDLKQEVCAERFRAYKECLQETVGDDCDPRGAGVGRGEGAGREAKVDSRVALFFTHNELCRCMRRRSRYPLCMLQKTKRAGERAARGLLG
jgi:hypothetical protein